VIVYYSQILADLENHALFKNDLECQKLILEAMKYHLLPERRTLMQSPRTKPRKSTVGTLYAVGGMDNNKGIQFQICINIYFMPYDNLI
jgi:kelch-like protein 1/4/5